MFLFVDAIVELDSQSSDHDLRRVAFVGHLDFLLLLRAERAYEKSLQNVNSNQAALLKKLTIRRTDRKMVLPS